MLVILFTPVVSFPFQQEEKKEQKTLPFVPGSSKSNVEVDVGGDPDERVWKSTAQNLRTEYEHITFRNGELTPTCWRRCAASGCCSRAVLVHGAPAPVRHPGRRSQVAIPDVAGPAAHGVRRRGLRHDSGVLLGAVPARVQLGQRRRARICCSQVVESTSDPEAGKLLLAIRLASYGPS